MNPAFTSDWATTNYPTWQRLLGHLRGQPHARGIEIGCWEGRSSLYWLEHVLTHETSRLTCIDPHYSPEVRRRFVTNVLAGEQGHRVHPHFDLSRKILPLLPEEAYDFVYVDGSHECVDVMLDACLAFHRLRKSGVLIFDDYELTESPEIEVLAPKLAIDTFVTMLGPWCEVLHRGWQVALRRLR